MGNPPLAARILEHIMDGVLITDAHKNLEVLARAFVIGGHELFVTASIGIALYPAAGIDTETLIHHADTAMHRAKQAGKNKYRLYSLAAT